MSKVVVYILDKAVWLLLITVITAQSLQIVGIMETPKGAGAIEYQDSILDQIPDDGSRWKRDTETSPPERSQIIDMLFNIPIKTLTAVNNLIQNSRPAFRKMREIVAQRLEKSIKASVGNLVQKKTDPMQGKEKN